MRSKVVKSAVGVTAALFFVCGLTFAKASNLNIIYRGEVGNHLTLAPGSYHVVVNQSPQPEVAFYQNGKLMGETPVKVVTESAKNDHTEVYYSAPHDNVRQITQIDFSGWKNKLLFSPSPGTGTAD